MSGEYFINGTDIWTAWGMFPLSGKGFYTSLLKAPSRKYPLTKNWADQNGTQRAFSLIEYDDRYFDLTFVITAANKTDLLANYNSFRTTMLTGEFTLKCNSINRLFVLNYKAMPSFDKLTTFVHDGKIAVELTVSVVDKQPTIFIDKEGDTIPMPFPADIPDGEIDFNDYVFTIVGNNLIMTGSGSRDDGINLNGNPLQYYGLTPQDGFHNELLKLPESKDLPNVYATRNLELPFYIIGVGFTEFISNYYSLLGFLLDSSYFNLDVNILNKRFSLAYSEMTAFDKLNTWIGEDGKLIGSLTISVFDDQPTSEAGLSLFNGRFTMNEEGHLIYTQSDVWDDKISFSVVDGELIKTIL